MPLNTNELEKISATRKKLDECHVKLYSLIIQNKLQDSTVSKLVKEDFVKKRENYGLYVAEFRNVELEKISDWLKNSQKSLLDGITNLENEIDAFNDLAETAKVIASVVGALSSLIIGLPL
jgi:hypothetical protein